MTGLDAPFTLEWGAHFPLVGIVQSVPRSELYAIVMVVSKVPGGNIYIVSDSEINVAMFYKTRNIALGSTNGDLWRTLFFHLDTNPYRSNCIGCLGILTLTRPKQKGTCQMSILPLIIVLITLLGWLSK